jgi:uncharacterized protein (DUF111 family)
MSTSSARCGPRRARRRSGLRLALNTGSGTVATAHGQLPIPAPATIRLLEGVPVYSNGVQGELVTPTGALLVSGHATSYGPMPAMVIRRTGYGAGQREVPGQPNVLRPLSDTATCSSSSATSTT